MLVSHVMDYFVFISKDTNEPWAIYCPLTSQLFTVSNVEITTPCQSINKTSEYIKKNYDDESKKSLSPMFSIKTSGVLKIDKNIATISPKKYSVIIPFSDERLDNLEQTLRFLSKENIASKIELILVCQKIYKNQFRMPEGFESFKIINLKSDVYCRAKMCNIGVEKSTAEIIVLLDSDRILPNGYFETVCSEIQLNQCITTENHWQLTHMVTDDEIYNKKYHAIYEPKSIENKMHKKGSFSGNTVLFKSDYISAGGMDESYEGYGYQDIDFSRTMIQRGMDMVFRKEKELHLFHKKPLDVRKNTIQNGIKYCKKWDLHPDVELIEIGNSIGVDVLRKIKKDISFL